MRFFLHGITLHHRMFFSFLLLFCMNPGLMVLNVKDNAVATCPLCALVVDLEELDLAAIAYQ